MEISISQPLSASLTLASLPFSESLHAKTGLVPSYQHSQIICCHKRVQKQNVLLTFNISVLGLLIHSETVINVTEMQIRVRTLPGGCEGAVKGPSLPPTWHSRMRLPLQGNTLCLFSSYWVPSLISSSKISLSPPPPAISASLSITGYARRFNDSNSQTLVTLYLHCFI